MSSESVQWPDLDPADIDVAEFDFSLYANGSTLASAVAEVLVLRGADAAPEQCLIGAPSTIGQKAYQRIKGHLPSVHYKLRLRAVFADGREKVLAGSWLCQTK